MIVKARFQLTLYNRILLKQLNYRSCLFNLRDIKPRTHSTKIASADGSGIALAANEMPS
jgi:hypothetical protein